MSYPSDVSDGQWSVLRPFLIFKRRGRKVNEAALRQTLNGILYVLRSGCQWRMLPKEYGHWQKVYGQYYRWRANGLLERVHDALRRRVRETAGRTSTPSLAMMDSQSVKTVQKGGSGGMTTARK